MRHELTPTAILGLGIYHPPRVVTNKDLETLLDTTDEWIVKRTGIRQRYWAEPEDSTAGLGAQAARAALAEAEVAAQDIDLLIVATLTPEHEFPGTACFIQDRLGIPGIPAIDVRQQCSGFPYALSLAQQYIATGTAKRVLLVAAELHSKCLDRTPRGRDISVLFGDGAGALVLGAADLAPTEAPRLIDLTLGADGSKAQDLWCPAPGTGLGADRITHTMIEEAAVFPQMRGRPVFQAAVTTMAGLLRDIQAANGRKLADIDLAVLHQANKRIADAIAGQLELPPEVFYDSIHEFGNTSAASIPIGLHEARAAGKLKSGTRLAIAAFGSGYTWGAALIDW